MAEYDSVWKEALEQFFELVLAFLFPELYQEIDWSVGSEALDTEARRLLKNLMNRKMELEAGRQLARLIDWLVERPDQAQALVWQEVRQHAAEDRMPFLSYPEQIGFDKGYDKGKQEGFDKGKEEGFDKGKQEGERTALLKGIELGLKLKFGPDGLALLPALAAQQDLALLQKVFDAIGPDTTLDDLRRLLPSA